LFWRLGRPFCTLAFHRDRLSSLRGLTRRQPLKLNAARQFNALAAKLRFWHHKHFNGLGRACKTRLSPQFRHLNENGPATAPTAARPELEDFTLPMIDTLNSTALQSQAATDLDGLYPESWCCVDCGTNTAPGCPNRAEAEQALAAGQHSVELTIGCDSEVYTVREAIWKKAGMEPMGGCLCIGCLERRLGRHLKRKDFLRDHVFNTHLLGSPRLMKRQKR
jgi:hypothetical protein